MKISIYDRFGRWTVISAATPYKRPSSGRLSRKWRVRCYCGTEREVFEHSLLSGNSQSCGCRAIEISRAHNTIHGEAKARTVEYITWKSMIGRCTNPSAHNYAGYGGRGITVCNRWRFGTTDKTPFECFLEDMGRRPGPGYSIDRYPDNDGNYVPGNVRWTTNDQQQQNRRVTLMVNIDGEAISLADACRRFSLSYDKIRARVRHGRTPEEAIRVAREGLL